MEEAERGRLRLGLRLKAWLGSQTELLGHDQTAAVCLLRRELAGARGDAEQEGRGGAAGSRAAARAISAASISRRAEVRCESDRYARSVKADRSSSPLGLCA